MSVYIPVFVSNLPAQSGLIELGVRAPILLNSRNFIICTVTSLRGTTFKPISNSRTPLWLLGVCSLQCAQVFKAFNAYFLFFTDKLAK